MAEIVRVILRFREINISKHKLEAMVSIVEKLLTVCSDAFRVLEAKVPPPQLVQTSVGPMFRCVEQSLEQAILQKLARVITSFRGILVLLQSGLYQEVAVLFRVLDELSEDVIFLCCPLLDGNLTDLHREYLASFYQEEFDDLTNPLASSQKRPTVSRKKIHAAIAAISESPVNPSDAQLLHRTLSQAYSGFVHAASVHVMDMYGGDPPRFHLAGMLGTPRQQQYEDDALHYFYRGLVTVMYAALAFKEKDLVDRLYVFRESFEKAVGMTDWPDPDKRVRDLRRGSV